MLWLAAQAFGSRAHVLSVDHGLRAEASTECATVAERAASLGLPHSTLILDAPPGPANVQAQARSARYAAMADWCCSRGIGLLATAHHADDQAETLLLRLARGSGIAGLAGIRPVQRLHGIAVVRPLLAWRRTDLAAALAPSGWVPADDPSNRDPRFDRARMRALLGREPMLDPRRLAASARYLADAEDALAWATDRAWASRAVAGDDAVLLDPESLPGEIQRRLLLRGLRAFGTAQPDGPDTARLLARLMAGGTGTLGGVKARALPDGRWRLSLAPPRKSRD